MGEARAPHTGSAGGGVGGVRALSGVCRVFSPGACGARVLSARFSPSRRERDWRLERDSCPSLAFFSVRWLWGRRKGGGGDAPACHTAPAARLKRAGLDPRSLPDTARGARGRVGGGTARRAREREKRRGNGRPGGCCPPPPPNWWGCRPNNRPVTTPPGKPVKTRAWNGRGWTATGAGGAARETPREGRARNTSRGQRDRERPRSPGAPLICLFFLFLSPHASTRPSPPLTPTPTHTHTALRLLSPRLPENKKQRQKCSPSTGKRRPRRPPPLPSAWRAASSSTATPTTSRARARRCRT